MATQYIRRGTDLAPAQSSKATANPIFVDSDVDQLKFGTGASGTSTKTVLDSGSTSQTVNLTSTSATPTNPTDALKASYTSAAAITSGTLDGLRGQVTLSGSTGAGVFAYGVTGRAVISGTIDSGSASVAAGYFKSDFNGATLTSGYCAPLQSNVVNPPASALTTVDLAYFESAGGNPINSFLKCFGKATYVFDLASNTHTQMSTTGTAGATTAKGWLKVLVEGAVRYIPLTDSVS